MSEKIAILGLGYVGLPLLVGLAKHHKSIIGFDIDAKRVQSLNENHDWTGEISDEELKQTTAIITSNIDDMIDVSIFVVTVPTPIDKSKRPDLTPVLSACNILGNLLKKKTGNIKPLIIFESTVYPGLTEEICGAEISKISGLKQSIDFKLGYSPERINPGDKINRLETITKIVSAEDEESLERVVAVYSPAIKAGLHKASSIKVAEAAKVIENTQRDINIALMNELAIICERMDMKTSDVLKAAGTKWNFLPFTPGLVGGHCIGVDPYYLTTRAEELGYHPQVILSGRHINDKMPEFIAQKVIKMLVKNGNMNPNAKVGILGISFKENVRDLRNSRVPEIVKELEDFGIEVLVYDPVVDSVHALKEYNISLCNKSDLNNLDAIILAVPHDNIMNEFEELLGNTTKNGIIIDIKSKLDEKTLSKNLVYWSL